MVNKGQKKRVLSESDSIGKLQDSNKSTQPLKKVKNIKQESGVSADIQKKGIKTASLPLNQQAVKKTKELKGKKMVLVNSKKVNLNYKLIKGEEKDNKNTAKQTIKKELKKEKGQHKLKNIEMSESTLEKKIAEIKSRENISITAKRRLRILKKKLAIAKGIEIPQPEKVNSNNTKTVSKAQARKKRRQVSLQRRSENGTQNDTTNSKIEKKPVKIEKKATQPDDKSAMKQIQNQNATKLGPVKTEVNKKQLTKGAKNAVQKSKQNGKNKSLDKAQKKDGSNKKRLTKTALPAINMKKIKDEEDESSDADEDEDENPDSTLNSSLNMTVDNDEDEDEDEEEEEDDDDDDDNDNDDDDDDDEEEEEILKKTQQGQKKQERPVKKPENSQNLDGAEKKKRYVLFVGNLPYEATSEDIKKHFLTKVSKVISVRIPTKYGTETPRGIAYVEVSNDTDYEKALSLHNSTINGRRLNVEYTKTGPRNLGNKKDLVAKNKKLHALRKAGVLAGSQKHDQKRSVRRGKHIKAN